MLKKLLSILSFCVLVLTIFTNIALVKAENVYYISSLEELYCMELNPSGTFYLTKNLHINSNIDMLFDTPNNSFSGVLDGGGYSIINATISSDSEYLGFIGFSSGTIRNVKFVNTKISAGKGCKNAGGIVYKNNGLIENCVFEGSVSIDNDVILGTGISALNYGDIINCTVIDNTTSVSSTSSYSSSNLVISYSSVDESSDLNSISSKNNSIKQSSKNNSIKQSSNNNSIEQADTSSSTINSSNTIKSSKVTKPSSTSNPSYSSSKENYFYSTSRMSISEYTISSDAENKEHFLPATYMLFGCCAVLIVMVGYVIFKEYVAIREERKKNNKK